MFVRVAILIGSILCATLPAWSVGALFVRPLNSSQQYSLISIKSYDATVTIQDHVATTHVDQTFHNEMSNRVEATFIFPLPDGAVITDLFYWFNGVRYKGSVRERKEAQATYDSKIRRWIDPALLQEMGDNIFKLNIAPIDARSDVRFEITYTEILPYALSTSTYKHLLKANGLSPKPLERISLRIDAETRTSWQRIEVPYYEGTSANAITAVNERLTRITFGDEQYTPTRDYVVKMRSNRDAVEMATLTYTPVPADSFGTEPFFMSWVLPPNEDARPLPRSIVFVADVSSSMEGLRMQQLRSALQAFLQGLQPQDRFNIVTFSTNVTAFQSDLVDATPENIEAAQEFVRTRTALGLTNISDALKSALSQAYAPTTANVCVFLTDGEPSWGEIRENFILDSAVGAWNPHRVRVFPIAVGLDPKLTLLNNLAKRTGGFVTTIERDDSIAVLVAEHLARISLPQLTDLALNYGGLRTVEVHPQVLPNITAGGRVTQHGRYETGGTFPVTLTGRLLEVPFTLTRDVTFGDPATTNRAVARLWARAKIDALMLEIERAGERKELVDAIIDLSIRFGILTKYTALYADPDDGNATDVPDERPVEGLAISVSPNPATTRADIVIDAESTMIGRHCSIVIHDVMGRVIARLYDGALDAQLRLTWDVRAITGESMPAGIYLLSVTTGDRTVTRHIIIR